MSMVLLRHKQCYREVASVQYRGCEDTLEYDGTARLDGYGIAVASTARRDASLVRPMKRVPKAKTRQAGGDSTFDGDRRCNPSRTRLCLLWQGDELEVRAPLETGLVAPMRRALGE
jgi:hypothetical protein